MIYEAGRESAKERPSSLLWVVCYYYNGGASQEEETEPELAVDKADFMVDGVLDGKAYMRALRQAAPSVEFGQEPGLRVRPIHMKLARFLGRRISEAQVAEGLHLLPDNKPWNRQPVWKVQLWQQYWAGAADERERLSRLR